MKSREETTGQLKEDLRKTREEVAIQKWGIEKTAKGMNALVKELIQKKKEIEEAKAKDEAILSSIGDAVMACDKSGLVMLFNNAAVKLTGFSVKEVISQHYSQALKFIRESDEKTGDDFIAKTITTGQATKMTNHTLLIRKDGQKIPVADSAAPIKNAKGEIVGCVVVFRDVSRERGIDLAKSEFVSLASHQLRTPLTGIQWVAERFARKEKLSSEGKEYLNDIIMATRRLATLVELLLNVTRIEEGKIGIVPRPVELVGLVKRFLQECHPLGVKNSLTLQFEKHPAILEIISDENVLRNIIQAIVSNAIEYTPRGGRVDVALEKKESTFLFTVSDTGIGIPKKDQPFVFKKLFRGSNANAIKTDGTGLGLYIAAEATKLFNGKIWFESPTAVETKAGKEENKGTTFYIELPLKVERKAGEKSLA